MGSEFCQKYKIDTQRPNEWGKLNTVRWRIFGYSHILNTLKNINKYNIVGIIVTTGTDIPIKRADSIISQLTFNDSIIPITNVSSNFYMKSNPTNNKIIRTHANIMYSYNFIKSIVTSPIFYLIQNFTSYKKFVGGSDEILEISHLLMFWGNIQKNNINIDNELEFYDPSVRDNGPIEIDNFESDFQFLRHGRMNKNNLKTEILKNTSSFTFRKISPNFDFSSQFKPWLNLKWERTTNAPETTIDDNYTDFIKTQIANNKKQKQQLKQVS